MNLSAAHSNPLDSFKTNIKQNITVENIQLKKGLTWAVFGPVVIVAAQPNTPRRFKT